MKILLNIVAFVWSITIVNAQNGDKQTQFDDFKSTVEKYNFPGFQGGNIKFNGCKFKVDLNNSKDTLIVQRIKVPDKDYSDPSKDKEVRFVAIQDINIDSIYVEEHDDYYFLEIRCKDQKEQIRYQLYQGDQMYLANNNKMGIGRFPKKDFSREKMDYLVRLLRTSLSK